MTCHNPLSVNTLVDTFFKLISLICYIQIRVQMVNHTIWWRCRQYLYLWRRRKQRWRVLHEDLYNLYTSPSILGMHGTCSTCNKGNTHKILVRKVEAKKSLDSSPRYKWEDNTKTGLKETGCVGADWTHLTQDTVQWQVPVNMIMNLKVT